MQTQPPACRTMPTTSSGNVGHAANAGAQCQPDLQPWPDDIRENTKGARRCELCGGSAPLCKYQRCERIGCAQKPHGNRLPGSMQHARTDNRPDTTSPPGGVTQRHCTEGIPLVPLAAKGICPIEAKGATSPRPTHQARSSQLCRPPRGGRMPCAASNAGANKAAHTTHNT